ncbi:MAG: UPF0175 family protein [Caldilineaceae bacterium]|nr:UPF0175 family protein [Caldilineaceae bacterium]
MNHQITIPVSDETILALKATPGHAGEELRLAAAIKLYEVGRLSSGAVAAVAGMPQAFCHDTPQHVDNQGANS